MRYIQNTHFDISLTVVNIQTDAVSFLEILLSFHIHVQIIPIKSSLIKTNVTVFLYFCV